MSTYISTQRFLRTSQFVTFTPSGPSQDSTSEFQAKVDEVGENPNKYVLFVDTGIVRLTRPIQISTPIRIMGVGNSPYVGSLGTIGKGTWFYLDHLGLGFEVDGGQPTSTMIFEKLGTYRNQPVPGPGWASNDHDFDISVVNCGTSLDDVVFLNGARAFKARQGNVGALRATNLRGQPMKAGIDIDECYNILQLAGINFSSFWSSDANVLSDTRQNLLGLTLARMDSPQLTNYYVSDCLTGIKLDQTAAGTVTDLLATNVEVNQCKHGIHVTNSVTNAMLGKVANLTVNGLPSTAGSKGIFVEGSNVQLQLDNLTVNKVNENAIRVVGTNNSLYVGACDVSEYNLAGTTFPAISALNTNNVWLSTIPKVDDPTYKYGDQGRISVNEWREYDVIVGAATGTLTNASATGFYKVFGDAVWVKVTINITTNGTAAGYLTVSNPKSGSGIQWVPTVDDTGCGIESSVTGDNLGIFNPSTSTTARITKYDGTYPGVDGGVYRLAYQFKIDGNP